MKKYFYLTILNLFFFSFFFLSNSFNSYSQGWEQIGPTPFLTNHSYGFSFEGIGYVIQGNDGNPLWTYTPNTDTWEEIGNFPGPERTIAVGDEWNGKYYYGFGNGSGSALNDLWEFDPANNTFTELPSCPCPGRSHPAFIAHNDKIMMGTGSSDFGDLSDWWEYDMITQVWTQKQDIPGGNRHHPFFFSADSLVFLGGGHRNSWFQYNLNTEELTSIDNTPQGRVAGTQFNYDGKGFVLAGDDASHSHVPQSQTFMMYDPQTGQWQYLPVLPDGSRWAPGSFIIDDILYFFDGVDYDIGSPSAVWKFDLTLIDCLPATNLNANNIDETYAEIAWIPTSGNATSILRYKKVSDPDWIEIPNAQPVFPLGNLEPCEEYEFQISSSCDTSLSFTDVITFQTLGCGSCVDLAYCEPPVFFNTFGAYINRVEINNYENISGENQGYVEFTDPGPEEIQLGQEVTLTIEVSETNSDNRALKVWIDLNQDGSFENNEMFVDETVVGSVTTTNFNLPTSTLAGVSRMRIAYANSANPNTNINLPACLGTSQLVDGEVEDYCILISETTNTDNHVKDNLKVFPNPFKETIRLKGDFSLNEKYQINILNVMGKTIKTINGFSMTEEVDLSGLANGVYFLQIENDDNSFQVKLVKQS